MSRVRVIEPHLVYSANHRTIDQCLLFAPNHRAENRLLSLESHPDALDPRNDHHPKPSMLNLFGAAVGRAQQHAPVRIHWFDAHINHYHCGISVTPESMTQFAPFFRNTNSVIARGVNKARSRTGGVFEGNYRAAPCLDDAAVESCLRYALTNVLKDYQVERLEESPFFSTYRQLAFGERPKYWYIDYEAYWNAGGGRVKDLRAKDFIEWVEVELTPVPGWEGLAVEERQRRVQQMAAEAEMALFEQRKREKRTVIGVPALFATDPRSRPANPKCSGFAPYCHATDAGDYERYKHKLWDIWTEYRRASWDYRCGDLERAFPVGTFKPPVCILTLFDSS